MGEAGGHKYGHLWGHVQVIKSPALLELVGPMPMSFPAVNHVQYRLTAEGTSPIYGLAPGLSQEHTGAAWPVQAARARAAITNFISHLRGRVDGQPLWATKATMASTSKQLHAMVEICAADDSAIYTTARFSRDE